MQVTRKSDQWMIRHGGVVAEHAILAGRARISIQSEHGPDALSRNHSQRFAADGSRVSAIDRRVERDMQVRNLAVYEQLLQTELCQWDPNNPHG